MTIKFETTYISVPEMIVKIENKGIKVDYEHANKLLEFKNYYRILPYFKLKTTSTKAPKNIDFKYIERRYKFDKRLRSIMLEATESIENFVKNDITEYFRVSKTDFYSDFLNSSNSPIADFAKNTLQGKLYNEFNRSSCEGLYLHRTKHGCTFENIPIWVLVESLEFGTTIWLIQEIDRYANRNKSRAFYNIIKNKYDINPSEYITCLNSSKSLRNMCAHGNRLYKSSINLHKPRVPKNWPLVNNSGNMVTADNTQGLYRKLIGLKVFYKNRQDYWIEFIITIFEHFESNQDLVSYDDYHFSSDFYKVLLDLW